MPKVYTSAGGLVFVTAALSFLLQAHAWSVLPRVASTRRPITTSARGRTQSLSSRLFSTPPPLASEGDWAAYPDERYGRPYYFNRATGESVWSKPTPTFPDVNLDNSKNSNNLEDPVDPSSSSGDNKPTLYQILNVPPTATRLQIKQSYLELAKRYHPEAVAKRGGDAQEGQRVFNDISRAYMVLSDDGLRRGYDESLNDQWYEDSSLNDQWETEETTMVGSEERSSGDQWANEDMGWDQNPIGPDGIRDATILRENKFEKNPVYKKKMEVDDASNDGRVNKFSRTGSSSPPPSMFGGVNGPFATAPPLEIDYEAEAQASRGPLTASQATILAQNAWREAISAEKESLQRDAMSQMEELRAAQLQARKWNEELERERREQQVEQSRRREERRKNAERGVMMDSGSGTNSRSVSIEERLRMRKVKRAGDEAERVGRELTKLGGLGAGLGGGGGSSGIVGGPSERPDAFFGSQGAQRSSVAKSSSNIREEQRLNSLLKKGSAAGGQPQRTGSMVAERHATGAAAAASKAPQARDLDREMTELKNKYEAEIDRLKSEMMQIADKSQSNQLKELVNNHKKELERVKQQMEAASNERLENELRMLEEKHASEMQWTEQQMQGGDAAGPFVMGTDYQEMKNVIDNLRQEHAAEVAKLKKELSNNANVDQSERMLQLEAAHKKDMDQLKVDIEAAAAQELQSKLQELEAAHKWQLQSLQSGHQAELTKSQKDAAEKLRWEVERSISSLKREHEREIEKLRSEIVMNVSESDAIEAMKLNHEAEMELLRAELFGEAASDLEEAIESLTREHQAEIAQVRADLEKKANGQLQQLRQELQASMDADLQVKSSEVEQLQQRDMEQVQRNIMENANLTESKQIKKLEETHRQEIEDLKKAADERMEQEILNIAKLHAGEITKLRDDLEASAANTIRDIQTESARQRQMEIDRAVSQLQMQKEQERERIRQDLMREIEQETGTKVFSQKAEMERLKSDLDMQSKQIMANEMRKLKQAHIGEMDALKRDIDKFYLDKMEQLKKDLIQKKRFEMEQLTSDLNKRHAMELDRVSGGMGGSPNAGRELARVAEEHRSAMEKLRSDLMAQADKDLQQRVDQLNQSHQREIEDLKRSMKAAAVADTLQFQTQANIQRTAEVDKATQLLKEAHQKELELLRRSVMANANASEKERMDMLQASHRDEIERLKAQMEASFARKLENELQLLEQQHQKQLNELRDEMSAKTREFANKEAQMQASQDKRVQQVQSEMQVMKEAHATEILSLKNDLLRNSDASYQKQINDLTASFNAELERVKADAAKGNTQLAGFATMPAGQIPQSIEEVLNSLQGVYPPDIIKKLRDEMNARNADLTRLSKDISSNTQQMNALQNKLDVSEQSQQTLAKTIQSLEGLKQKAESDMKTKANQLQAATAELERLKREVSSRSQSSDAVLTLQKEVRAKTNELANLNAKITTLKRESSELRSRLEAIDAEKVAMVNEINQLKEWKRKAEANQKKERDELESQISRLKQELMGTKNAHKQKIDEMDNKLRAEIQEKRSVIERFTRDLRGKDDTIKKLEGSLSQKDTEISTLKHGLRERNEDVSTLVPEVDRLQKLNAEMKSVNDSRLKEFTALKAEAERLKIEFERGSKENLSTVQQLTAKLEREQSQHAEFIKKLEQTAKTKADEINTLQSNLSDKTKKITDLEKKLGSFDKMSTDLASLEEYRITTEKSIAESKRTIQTLQRDLAKEKDDADKKAARIKELERLQESMFGKDGEIQRLKKDLVASGEEISRLKAELDVTQATNKKMAQDISEFKSVRYSSEASLKKTNDELALTQRDVARLKREIENLKQSEVTKTQSIKDLERKLTEKESQLKSTLASNESEVLRLSSNVKTFASEKEKLLAEVEKLSVWKTNAEETISTQCRKIESINSQLQRMEKDLSGAPSSEYETLLKERATLIEQLAAVKQELVQKNDKIQTTKIQTENLLRRNRSHVSTVPSGATARTVRTPILSNSVVVGEFSSRRRNIAEDSPSKMIKTFSAPPSPTQQQTSTAGQAPSVQATPQQPEKAVVAPPNAPTLLEISSNIATTLTKPASSNTMSAYDQALAKAKQAADAKSGAVSEPKAKVITAPPMSGWAGYKDSRFGGYLDNLSESKVKSAPTSTEKAYQYKDNAQKGFGYLDNLSQPAKIPSPSQNESDRKQEYLAAEKQFLLDAKNLALTAAKSFQEAQTKPNDKAALETANAQKREVDELLAKAKEMRAKAEAITSSKRK